MPSAFSFKVYISLLFHFLFNKLPIYLFVIQPGHNGLENGEQNQSKDKTSPSKPPSSSNGVTCYANSAIVESNGNFGFDSISVVSAQVWKLSVLFLTII